MKISIIAPTYNEVRNVQLLVKELERSLAGLDYEVIIADDDSPDLTWAKVDEIGKRNPRIRTLRRTAERGLGRSVLDGFAHATGDAVACIDADLQHDPAILPQMAQELERGYELVVGSRYVAGGSTGEWGWFRRFESWVATRMAQALLSVKLQDPLSGYFMLRRTDFLRVAHELNGGGFKILLEILARLKPKQVAEVPYTFRTRQAGTSKLSSEPVVAYLRQLWRLSLLGRFQPR